MRLEVYSARMGRDPKLVGNTLTVSLKDQELYATVPGCEVPIGRDFAVRMLNIRLSPCPWVGQDAVASRSKKNPWRYHGAFSPDEDGQTVLECDICRHFSSTREMTFSVVHPRTQIMRGSAEVKLNKGLGYNEEFVASNQRGTLILVTPGVFAVPTAAYVAQHFPGAQLLTTDRYCPWRILVLTE